ncbi:MAG: flagellar biosynthetic protein FliO [Acidocella sp.]|nr:flagellar biosynthetic protein FliO [Acidocella sp.]
MSGLPVFGVPDILSAAVSLAIILLCLAGAAMAARKLRRRGGLPNSLSSSTIRIVATRSLGWQSSLLIVEAQGTRFLVGRGRAGVTAIGAFHSMPSAFTEDRA